MLAPRALRPGDTIGVVAPSGPVERKDLEPGVEVLSARGYRVVLGAHVQARADHCDYLAGSDAERASDLNALLVRDDVQAVLCARGGYGAMRLLDLLDWEAFRNTPKIVGGYSDITALHAAFGREAGWITMHSPVVCGLHRLDAISSGSFWRLLEEPVALGVLPTGDTPVETLVPGRVEGRLAGGCISLLAHLCGSRYAPDFRDRIVLLEDVGEAIYRTDRDLIQLRNAGLLDQAAGFVVGTITRWRSHEADPPRNSPETLWKDILTPLGKPAVYGFPFGHEPNPLTLPLGVPAFLDADRGTLTLLDAATV